MRFTTSIAFLATAPWALAFTPSTRTFSARPVLSSPLTTSRQVVSLGPKAPSTTYTTRLFSEAVAAEGGEELAPRRTGGGTATIPQLIFNLVKGIVGAGVLGLPAGIVAFGNAPSATIPAFILITLIGMLSGYGFALIGRVCAYTDTTSFREAWTASVSSESSWIPAWTVTFKTVCALLAYSMILGDTFSSLFSGAGLAVSSTNSLLGVTGLVLLPLCLLRNLAALAPFSLLGSAGKLTKTLLPQLDC